MAWEWIQGGNNISKKENTQDKKNPFFGLDKSRQNKEFLQNSIKELKRNTQSKAHFKAFGAEGTMGEAKKKLRQYEKALKCFDK